MYNHVFEQEKNRVEFLADWPTGNDANIISSLQVRFNFDYSRYSVIRIWFHCVTELQIKGVWR